MERYVAAVDQGTTSTRCILFDQGGRLVSVAQAEHAQHYPRPGWVEHDAVEIWRNLTRIVPEAVEQAGVAPEQVVAIGIANQRETTLVWERDTGRPVGRAVVWQDTRTGDMVEALAGSHGSGWRGCSSTSRACAGAPSAARCCSGRWRPGWSGTSRADRTAACTSPT